MLTIFSASKLFNVPYSDGESVGNVLKRLVAHDPTIVHGGSPLLYSIPRASLWAGVSLTIPSQLVQPSATISEVTHCGNVLFVDFTAATDSPLSPNQCSLVPTLSPKSHSPISTVSPRPCPLISTSSLSSSLPIFTVPLISPGSVIPISPTSSQCSSLVCLEDNINRDNSVVCGTTPVINNDIIDLVATDEEEKMEGPDVLSYNNCNTSIQSCTKEKPAALDGVLFSSSECDEGVVLDNDSDDDVMIVAVEGESDIRVEQIISVLKVEMSQNYRLKWSTRRALRHLRRVFGEAVMKKKRDVRQYVRNVRKYGMSTSPPPSVAPSLAPVTNCCGITLTRGDLSTLAPQKWLNDQVINAFMRLLMKSAGDRVHITNTFFYSKYKQTGYQGIKTWLRKVKVFKLSQLIIPVHLGAHWCLVAVHIKKQRIEYYDSLARKNKTCLKKILLLLWKIARKEKRIMKARKWRRIYVEKIPRQLNSCDCGVFICEYARWLCTKGALSTRSVPFSQQDMPDSRRKILHELQQQ